MIRSRSIHWLADCCILEQDIATRLKGLAMSQAVQARSPVIPREVLAFALEQGVDPYLPAVLQMTDCLFASARVDLQVDEDPEIAQDRHITIKVAGGDMQVAQALEARYQWHRELFNCCPAPLVCIFRLGLELNP